MLNEKMISNNKKSIKAIEKENLKGEYFKPNLKVSSSVIGPQKKTKNIIKAIELCAKKLFSMFCESSTLNESKNKADKTPAVNAIKSPSDQNINTSLVLLNNFFLLGLML